MQGDRTTSHKLQMLPVSKSSESKEEEELQRKEGGCFEDVVVTCGSTGRCMAGASEAELPLGWEESERGGTGGCGGLISGGLI